MDDLQSRARLAIGRQVEVTCEYTLMRCPSRIVTVGSRLRNRSRTRVARLRDAGGDALAIGVEGGRVEPDAGLPLREAGDRPERERHPKDLRVVPIDLIAQAEVADLVEAVKLVQGRVGARWAG